MKLKIIYFVLTLFSFSCTTRDSSNDVIFSDYKPILMDAVKVSSEIAMQEPRSNSIITGSSSSGDTVILIEYGLGLHIVDISNPNQPRKLGFLTIPACIDAEIRNGKIYANNLRDFIVVDISDFNNPKVINRTMSAFDIEIEAPDGKRVVPALEKIPSGTVIISYERI